MNPDESFENARPVAVARAEPPDEAAIVPPMPAPVAPRLTPTRQMPASEEAERHMLSCCLIDGSDTIARCLEARISPEALFYPANQIIFEKLCALYHRNIPITLEVLIEELRTARQLDAVGGIQYLLEVSSFIPTTAHASYFIEKVRELHLLREVIRAAHRTVEDAYNFTGGLTDFLTMARLRLPAPDVASGNNTYTVWQPAAFRAFQPPPDMNLVGGGYIRRKQLTTLIGPPGVGKSRLSLWLACLHICGRPFMGLDCLNGPAKWLFFGNENDPMRQKNDLEWFYRNLTAEEQAKVDANLFLHVLEQPDDGIITLADPDAFAKLCATLKQVKPDAVVFDPWGNMIEGNENDNEEVRRTLKFLLRAIRNNSPESAIIVIHHARTGKATAIEAGNNYSGGSLGRGSKALVSSARCELALWPGDSEDSSKLVITCEKANNVQKFEPKGLLFENGIYRQNESFDLKEWRDDIDGNRGGKSISIKDLVAMVKEGCHRSNDIVARAEDEFGVSRRTVFVRLSEACDKGYLAKCQPPGSYTLGKVNSV